MGSMSGASRDGGLESLVEVEADLGQHREVRAEPREHDDAVEALDPRAVLADEGDGAVVPLDGRGAEAGDDLDGAGVDGGPGPAPERPAGGQLVGVASPEGVADTAAAQDPDHLGARDVLGDGG